MFESKLFNNLDFAKKDYISLYPGKSFDAFKQQSIIRAVILGFVAWFLFVLYTNQILEGFFVFVIVTISAIAISFSLIKTEKKKQAELMEKDLPFALMNLSVELKINIPFIKCLENLSKGSYGKVSKEFSRVIKEINSGKSVQKALFDLSERFDSIAIKQSISQMINVYEQGNQEQGSNTIKKIAKDQLLKQKSISKEFAGKMVVYSLIFITVSAIVPAMYQTFSMIGPLFPGFTVSADEIFNNIVFGFPIIDVIILLFIRSKTPLFLK